MKQSIFLSYAAMKRLVFICLLLIILAGCSNDSMGSDSQNDGILPIAKEKLNQNVLLFFNEKLPNNRVEKSKAFFTSLEEDEEVCLLINSNEEFQNAYEGNSSLPTIDFIHYTLVLGKLYCGANYILESQYLTKKDNESLLILTFNQKPAVAEMLPLYYWGIYSKINVEEIKIKKVIK